MLNDPRLQVSLNEKNMWQNFFFFFCISRKLKERTVLVLKECNNKKWGDKTAKERIIIERESKRDKSKERSDEKIIRV